ncbi:hypothetical protein DFQ26_009172 [Actinomortierella ambigua]|nr:hypothetical protein DFQ26_009172 [Actinomortierella ambigua]
MMIAPFTNRVEDELEDMIPYVQVDPLRTRLDHITIEPLRDVLVVVDDDDHDGHIRRDRSLRQTHRPSHGRGQQQLQDQARKTQKHTLHRSPPPRSPVLPSRRHGGHDLKIPIARIGATVRIKVMVTDTVTVTVTDTDTDTATVKVTDMAMATITLKAATVLTSNHHTATSSSALILRSGILKT